VRTHGVAGLYVGFPAWLIFSGPKAAIKFSVYEVEGDFPPSLFALNQKNLPPRFHIPNLKLLKDTVAFGRELNPALADAVGGLVAGVAEAAFGQTPNQAISTKMLHDASPAGSQRFRSFSHAVQLIYAEHGVIKGFFCGLEPAVIKGALTNGIRFPIFGALKRLMQDGDECLSPLPPHKAALAGAAAGIVSAIVTQPIDTIMAQAQGLESGKFQNSFSCARTLVAAGGIRALYFGLPTRCIRVAFELALQFSLYEQVSCQIDRWLDG
jgi:solute carrier family 25 citrate transporter 1